MACRKRYVEEPRKPQRLLRGSDERKPTEMGHVRVKNPETAWARVESRNKECSGRLARARCPGVSYQA